MKNARLFGVMAEEKKYDTPLVFIHGAWVGAWCWEEHFMEWFASKGYDVFAVQLRGHGFDNPFNSFSYPGVQDFLKDIIQAVDHLDENPILIGHSMGAYLLQHYAHKFHADTLIMCTPVPPSGIYKMSMQMAMKYPFESGLFNMNLLVPPMDVIPNSARKILFSNLLDPEKGNEYLSKMHAESPRAFMDMAYPVNTKTHDDTEVFVLGAENDTIVSWDEVKETAHAYGTEPRMMKGAHHLFMLDANWEECAQSILDCIELRIQKADPVI